MLSTRRKAKWALAICLLLGTAAAAGFAARAIEYEQSLGRYTTVWSAGTDIPAHTPITDGMLVPTAVPERFAPASAVLSPDEILGRVSLVPLRRGDLITSSILRRADPGYQALPLSERDRTVQIDPGIQAGDRVAILASYREGDADVTRYIFTGVEVLAADREPEGRDLRVSLRVTPEQALDIVRFLTVSQRMVIVRQG